MSGRYRSTGLAARLAAYSFIALLWLVHWLPLGVQDWLGRGLGALLYRLARSRRGIALRNLELCFPERSAPQREALAREHFAWLARSYLERGLLWFASPARLQRLMRIEGDIALSEHCGRPVMWLMPHFVGLDWSAPAIMLNQACPGASIYQRQSNPVVDRWLRRARERFGRTQLVDRHDGVRAILRAVRSGHGFLNLPDMDFGAKDSAFIPFFGVPACTLLAPAKIAQTLDMVVQPIVVTLLPRGQGILVRAHEPLQGYPSGDLEADALLLNRWIEARILEQPAQYLWVHKRFKTRPAGEPSLYTRR
ncbi:lipid A biosynthesis acyltransferase [Roseateles sp. BYS180W]|uniref:Lipid A biosynthesis acyltransferase n=1 Tax=Roseateles rivi TaxID=3299028 RepID=A0ABW7FR06_9BURK